MRLTIRLLAASALWCGVLATGLGLLFERTASAQFETNPFVISELAETVYPVTGNRYILLSIGPYIEANNYATSLGGWLWTVNNLAEMNYVIDAFLPARQQALDTFVAPPGFATDPDGSFYIGLTDSEIFGATEGNFQWNNGEPVGFTNWSGGEPNNVGVGTGLGTEIGSQPSGEDYAEIWNLDGDRTWNDDNDRGSGLNGLPPSTPLARLPSGGNFAVVELPPVPPPFALEIDPASGYARVVSTTDVSLELRSYEITSSLGMLSSAAWEGTNLTARGVDSVDPGQIGQHWDVINSEPGQLLEAFLFGGSTIAPGGSLILGQVMLPVPNGQTPPAIDTFEFNIATSSTNPNNPNSVPANDVPISYAAFALPSLAGDYNDNGVVDAADYTVWRDSLGATGTGLAADGNNNNVIDQADYNVWRTNFGQTAATGGALAAAVPEPHALLALLACTAAIGATAARSRRAA